jgi:hypothetical protein
MSRLSIAVASVLVGLAIGTSGAAAGVIAEGSAPGHRVEALDLKSDGAGMVTLTLRITNDSDRPMELSCALRISAGDCRDVSGITLIDAVNKKRHLVVQDSDGKCVCTTTLSNLPAKSSTTVWAKFAAPPAAVKTVTAVVPLFLPLEAVPITGP